DAALVAEKLLEALAAPLMVSGGELSVTASIGISVYPDDGQDAEGLVQSADIAMYKAKTSGGSVTRTSNCCVTVATAMHHHYPAVVVASGTGGRIDVCSAHRRGAH